MDHEKRLHIDILKVYYGGVFRNCKATGIKTSPALNFETVNTTHVNPGHFDTSQLERVARSLFQSM